MRVFTHAPFMLFMSNQSYLLRFSLQKMVSFVECMLGLDTERLGDLIGTTLLEKVVDLLIELDVWSFPFIWLGNLSWNQFFILLLIDWWTLQVNITWEDILQEEHSKGIFDMELEDLDDDEDNLGQEGTKVCHIWNVLVHCCFSSFNSKCAALSLHTWL